MTAATYAAAQLLRVLPRERITKAVGRLLDGLPPTLKIEVETTTLEEVKEALAAGADIIMLDNFSPQRAQKAISYLKEAGLRKKILIEISGGVNLSNIKEYANALPNMISIGSLTHSSKSIDFSMEMELING